MLTIHGFSQAVSPAGQISIAADTSCCSRVCDLATSFSSCTIWWFLLSERSEKSALDREWWSHVDQVHERSWRTSSSSGTREICVIILRWEIAVPCGVEQLQRVQLRMRSRNSCSRASWREIWRLSISATCEILLSMAGHKIAAGCSYESFRLGSCRSWSGAENIKRFLQVWSSCARGARQWDPNSKTFSKRGCNGKKQLQVVVCSRFSCCNTRSSGGGAYNMGSNRSSAGGARGRREWLPQWERDASGVNC